MFLVFVNVLKGLVIINLVIMLFVKVVIILEGDIIINFILFFFGFLVVIFRLFVCNSCCIIILWIEY